MKKLTPTSLRIILAALCLLVALLANHAGAAVLYWDNNGTATPTSSTWNTTSSQWATSSTLVASPGVWATADAACFTAGSGVTGTINITVNSAITVGGIFNGSLNPSGCTLSLINGGSGSLNIASGVQAAFSAGGSDGDPTYDYVPWTGPGQLWVEGGNQQYLYAINAHSGGTYLDQAGILNITNGAAFGTGPIVMSATGGAIQNLWTGTGTTTITNAVTAGTYNLNIVPGSVGLTFSGPWSLGSSTPTIGAGATAGQVLTISGAIGGTGNFIKYNSGTLVLSGVNTFTGWITNSGGPLIIGGSGKLNNGSYAGSITNYGTFAYNSSANQTLSGVITGTGALTMTNSAATLTLSGVNSYTGATTIGAGTLTIGGAGQLNKGSYAGAILNNGTLNYISTASQDLTGVISGSGSLVLNSSPTLTTGNYNLTLGGTVNTYSGTTTINGGLLQIGADACLGTAPGTATPGSLTLNCGTTAGLRANASFTLNANRGVALGANGGSFHASSGATLTYNGIIAGTGSFSSGAGDTLGYGTIKLGGANTYSGTTTVAAGTLQLGASGTLPATTAVTIASDQSIGSILDLNGFSQTIGSLASSPGIGGTGTKTPTLKLSGALTINQNSSTVFAGVISGSGGSLTLNGTGTLELSGANTYTGPTTVGNGAVLKLDNSSALGATTSLTLNSSPSAGTINLNFSGTQTVGALNYGLTSMAQGTWGAIGSTATHQDAAFTGTGILNVTGGGASQTITFANPGTQTYGVAPITLGANAPGGTVTYTVTAGPATVVGSTLTITGVGSVTVEANQAGNNTYNPAPAVDQTFAVNPAVLTVAANGTLVYGQDPSNAVYAPTYYPLQGTDTVAVISGGADFTNSALPTDYIGTNDTVTVLDTGTLTAANYTFVAAITNGVLTITPAPLTVTNVLASDKTYDGTTVATADASGAGLSGLVNGDAVTLDSSLATGVFASKNAGPETVVFSGFATVGDLGTNYTLIQPTATANISQLAITVTAAADTKGYDSTTSSVGVPTPSPALATGDTASFTQTFDTSNVGTGKTLTPAGAVNDGNGGANYSVTFAPAATGEIDAAPLTVTAATDSKTYDGTTSSVGVPTITSGTLMGSDTAPVWTQSFSSRNAGPDTLIPAGVVNDGNGGANYAVTYATASGSISQLAVTVTAVTDTKPYDGTTISAGVPTYTALGATDTASFAQSFDTRNTGTGKTLTPAGLVNDGNGGLNYAYTYTPVTSGEIDQTPITVTATANTKVYDGTTSAAAVPSVSPGVVAGDIASFSETYDTKNMGTGKTLTPAGLVTDGNGGANYAVTFANNTAGEIDAKAITVTAATDTKVYDGTTTSVGLPTVPLGAIAAGDTAPAWTQTFDSPDVGARTLTPAGVVGDGNGGANYAVTYATASGSITAVSSATALVSSQNPSTNGVSVTFTATVSSTVGTPTGNVVFLTNGVALATVALSGGSASTATVDLPVGTIPVEAQYAAQANWQASSDSLSQVVNSAVTLSTTNVVQSIVNNGDGTFTLTLLGTPGANYYVVASGDVTAPMAAWTGVVGSTNPAGLSGQWTCVVSNAAPAFYRSVAVNPAP